MFRHTKVVDLQNTLDEMQHEMNEVNTWSNEKNLCFNAKRTKVILFSTSQMSRRQNLQNTMVRMFNKEQPMEQIFEVKVLGMTFNQHLTWRMSRQCDHTKLLFHTEVLTNLQTICRLQTSAVTGTVFNPVQNQLL